LVTIVVDSLAGATTKVEQDADFDKDGYATTKAILLSKAMRKITNLIAKERICVILTNQLRQKMNAMAFADPYVTSGGKAVGFHASVRIRLSNAGALKKKDFGGVDAIVGTKIQAKVVKNRLGPAQRKATFEIFYNSGIDNYSGWVTVLKTYKFIKGSGAYNKYNLEKPDGSKEEFSFLASKLPEMFEERPDLKESMYNDLCTIMIMTYQANGQILMNDDVEVDKTEAGGIE
jgi:recombination protein RecA